MVALAMSRDNYFLIADSEPTDNPTWNLIASGEHIVVRRAVGQPREIKVQSDGLSVTTFVDGLRFAVYLSEATSPDRELLEGCRREARYVATLRRELEVAIAQYGKAVVRPSYQWLTRFHDHRRPPRHTPVRVKTEPYIPAQSTVCIYKIRVVRLAPQFL
jgi:hypothetical protein